MPVTEFDNLLREQFEQGSFEYKPANWERLSKELPVPKKKKPLIKRLFWLPLVAAAAATAGFIVLPLMRDTQTNTSTVQQTVVAKNTAEVKTTTPPPTTVNSAVVAPVMGFTGKPSVLSPHTAVYPIIITYQHTAQAPSVAQKVPAPSGSDPVIDEKQDAAIIPNTTADAPQNNEPAAAQPETQQPVDPPKKNNNANYASNSRLMNMPYIIDGIQYEEPRQKVVTSSLSIAGGYKYGTANMGYMIGLNGRKSLSEKIFIEGDFAFANSRNSQVTNEASNETFDQVKTIAGTNAIAARALTRGEVISNMYYLQLTPTVGYQVFKTMSVGAGADVQRMFGSAESTVYVMEGTDVKAMPQMDYGVVGKAEYSLSKTFKAGIQYRQGMNGVISPEKNLFNRSYLQVQLKLGILGR